LTSDIVESHENFQLRTAGSLTEIHTWGVSNYECLSLQTYSTTTDHSVRHLCYIVNHRNQCEGCSVSVNDRDSISGRDGKFSLSLQTDKSFKLTVHLTLMPKLGITSMRLHDMLLWNSKRFVSINEIYNISNL